MGLCAFDKNLKDAKTYADSFKGDRYYGTSSSMEDRTCSSYVYGDKYTVVPTPSDRNSLDFSVPTNTDDDPIAYASAKRDALEEDRKNAPIMLSGEEVNNEFSKTKDESLHELALLEKMRATVYEVTENIPYEFDGDTTLIEEYIRNNIDSEFDISKYKIKMWDDNETEEFGQTLITFMYCINDEIVGVGYRAYIEDNKLAVIYADGVPVYEDTADMAKTALQEEVIKEKALADSIWLNEGFEVENQYMVQKLDNNNNPYVIVTTNFLNNSTLDCATDIYICDIEGNRINIDEELEPLVTDFINRNEKFDKYLIN